jgi:hypothetical protein
LLGLPEDNVIELPSALEQDQEDHPQFDATELILKEREIENRLQKAFQEQLATMQSQPHENKEWALKQQKNLNGNLKIRCHELWLI